MGTTKRLMYLIKKQRERLDQLPVGSEEYTETENRLMALEEMLSRHKEGQWKIVIEGVKVVGGIALPVFGYVTVTAFEKGDSFSSSLKKVIDCFIPKRP